MSKPKTPTSAAASRRRHSTDFKLQAVDLAQNIGIAQAAADLGVSYGLLHSWMKKVDLDGRSAFVPLAERNDVAAENKRLRAENRILKMERDILKKAATFFAKENT